MDRRPPQKPPGLHPSTRLILIAGAIAAIIVAAASLSPVHLDGMQWARLGSGVLVLGLVAARLAVSRRALHGMAGQAAIWVAIGAVLVIGYSYRDTLNDIFGRVTG